MFSDFDPSTHGTSYAINNHALESSSLDDSIINYRGGYIRPKLSKEIFDKFSSEDKITWDKLLDKTKYAVVTSGWKSRGKMMHG
jgi:hypothetical protein